MRREFQETGREQLFSRVLVDQTREALDRGEQALILLNRRGYSFAVICRPAAKSSNARTAPSRSPTTSRRATMPEWPAPAAPGVPLLRFQPHRPSRCPSATASTSTISAPDRNRAKSAGGDISSARIGRMDRDTVRGRYDLERLLARLHSGEINLLVVRK